ncbi:Uncharacterized protein TCM_040469 [Theobroma cacao]|uniref:Uncharacterized protein n=1 Tax=Theobroma cacao TaxID=3641 RepID=A0A061GZ36_THECC|nr:Uncharacterized protein TCM_040469 [Theobroma cacao]
MFMFLSLKALHFPSIRSILLPSLSLQSSLYPFSLPLYSPWNCPSSVVSFFTFINFKFFVVFFRSMLQRSWQLVISFAQFRVS